MSILNPSENNNKVYDFETQLELGEMLLGLGRLKEAEVELKKARELNEIGSYSTPDGDPRRAEQLQRLHTALERVESIGEKSRSRGRLGWIAATLGLGALAAALLIGIIFNRAEVSEMSVQSTIDAQALATESAVLKQSANIMGQENTRTVREIQDQKAVIATIQAENAKIEAIAVGNMELATVAAENAQLIQTVESSLANSANNQAPVVVTVEVAGTAESEQQVIVVAPATEAADTNASAVVELDDQGRPQYRVLTASNVRLGPGLEYPIIIYLRRGEAVTVIAQSEDARWFNIQTPEGRLGWIHSSLVELISLGQIPFAATLPPPPEPAEVEVVPPTPVPAATESAPTAVPPTPVPAAVEPTAVPQQEETQSENASTETVDPAEAPPTAEPVQEESGEGEPTGEGESNTNGSGSDEANVTTDDTVDENNVFTTAPETDADSE